MRAQPAENEERGKVRKLSEKPVILQMLMRWTVVFIALLPLAGSFGFSPSLSCSRSSPPSGSTIQKCDFECFFTVLLGNTTSKVSGGCAEQNTADNCVMSNTELTCFCISPGCNANKTIMHGIVKDFSNSNRLTKSEKKRIDKFLAVLKKKLGSVKAKKEPWEPLISIHLQRVVVAGGILIIFGLAGALNFLRKIWKRRILEKFQKKKTK